MISVCFQGKPFNIIVIQVYAPTTNTAEAKVEWFYEDLQDHLELSYAMLCYAKSLQSFPTLCDSIPGILQAKTLEWVAISFSNA